MWNHHQEMVLPGFKPPTKGSIPSGNLYPLVMQHSYWSHDHRKFVDLPIDSMVDNKLMKEQQQIPIFQSATSHITFPIGASHPLSDIYIYTDIQRYRYASIKLPYHTYVCVYIYIQIINKYYYDIWYSDIWSKIYCRASSLVISPWPRPPA